MPGGGGGRRLEAGACGLLARARHQAQMARISNIAALGVFITNTGNGSCECADCAWYVQQRQSSSMFQPLLLLCRCCTRPLQRGVLVLHVQVDTAVILCGGKGFLIAVALSWSRDSPPGAIDGSHHGHHHSLRMSCFRSREEKKLGVQLMHSLSFNHQGWHFSWFRRWTLMLGEWGRTQTAAAEPSLP